MSRADFDKWQSRYGGEPDPPRPPEPFVVECLDSMTPAGRALDVAGGLGRHALELSRRGLQTTLLDVSPAGLSRAAAEAARRGLALETVAADLDADPLPEGPFEVVVIAWFLLTATTWRQVVDRMSPGGSLLYVQPTLQNQERHAHPRARFLVEPGALAAAARAAGLQVVTEQVGWDPRDHHTERLWARRPRP